RSGTTPSSTTGRPRPSPALSCDGSGAASPPPAHCPECPSPASSTSWAEPSGSEQPSIEAPSLRGVENFEPAAGGFLQSPWHRRRLPLDHGHSTGLRGATDLAGSGRAPTRVTDRDDAVAGRLGRRTPRLCPGAEPRGSPRLDRFATRDR